MTPKPVPTTTQVAFRFEDDLLKRVDRHARRTSGNRADAVRDLLAQALDDLDEGKERYPTKTRTTVLRWHQPKCSHCKQPIEKIGDGHAAWREEKHRSYDPMILHAGGFDCSFYKIERAQTGHVLDSPLVDFRQSPMEAIKIALRHRGTRPERGQWLIWLSIVLGLPFSVTDLLMLSVDDSDTMLPDHVPKLENALDVLGDT